MSAIEIKSPETDEEFREYTVGRPRVFLAGSIEQGKAENWQELIVKALEGTNALIFNPRRDDWDATWEQDPNDEDSEFYGQVNWELDYIDQADLVVFWFDANTISPITLLELGYCLGSNKPVIVYCPTTYFRYGNVHIMMKRYSRLLYLFTEITSREGFARYVELSLMSVIYKRDKENNEAH